METKSVSLAEAIFKKKPLDITRRTFSTKNHSGIAKLPSGRSIARSELVKDSFTNKLPVRGVAAATTSAVSRSGVTTATASVVARPEAKITRPLSARVVFSKGTNTLKTSSVSPRLSSSFSTDGSLSLKESIKTADKPKNKVEKSNSNNSLVIASDYENKVSTLKHIVLLRYILANRNREENIQTRTDLLSAWQLVYDAEEEASALNTREILADELISIHRKLCSL